MPVQYRQDGKLLLAESGAPMYECCCPDSGWIPSITRVPLVSPIIGDKGRWDYRALVSIMLVVGSNNSLAPGDSDSLPAGVGSAVILASGPWCGCRLDASLRIDTQVDPGSEDPPAKWYLSLRGIVACGGQKVSIELDEEGVAGQANWIEGEAWIHGSVYKTIFLPVLLEGSYPLRERVDLPDELVQTWSNDPGVSGRVLPRDMDIRWTTWPEDCVEEPAYFRVTARGQTWEASQATAYAFWEGEPATEDFGGSALQQPCDPLLGGWDLLDIRTGAPSGTQAGDPVKVTGLKTYGQSPKMVPDSAAIAGGVTYYTDLDSVTVTASNDWTPFSNPYIQIRMAAPYDISSHFDIRSGIGQSFWGNLSATGLQGTISLPSGAGVHNYQAPSYYLFAGTIVDYRHQPTFNWGLNSQSLAAAGCQPQDTWCPLYIDRGMAWAGWDAVEFRTAPHAMLDDGSDASGWTPTGLGLSVVAGALRAAVGASGQLMSRLLRAEDIAIHAGRYLNINISSPGANQFRIYINKGGPDEKRWTLTKTSSGYETMEVDLLSPENASGVDTSYHCRWNVEWEQAQPGYGYGVANCKDRSQQPPPYNGTDFYPDEEDGNFKAAITPVLTIEFLATGNWDVNEIRLESDSGYCGFADHLLDADGQAAYDEFQSGEGNLQDRYQHFGRREAIGLRGWFAIRGNIQLDEQRALGYSDGQGRSQVGHWIGDRVFRNIQRQAGRGTVYLHSLRPHPGNTDGQSLYYDEDTQQKRLVSEGGIPYSWPEQYCNESCFCLHVLPMLEPLSSTATSRAALSSGQVTYGPGISRDLTIRRWLGGGTHGVVVDPGDGARQGVQVTGSGPSSFSDTSDTEGTWRGSPASRKGQYTVETPDQSGQVPHGDVWQRISFSE